MTSGIKCQTWGSLNSSPLAGVAPLTNNQKQKMHEDEYVNRPFDVAKLSDKELAFSLAVMTHPDDPLIGHIEEASKRLKQRAQLVEALKPMTQGTEWITAEQVEKAKALLSTLETKLLEESK